MDPERWRRVSGLLQDAIALQPSDRAAFLDAHCPDGEDRREVESLLGHHDAGVGWLETGAAASLPPPQARGLEPGHRLGAYRVVREVGRGGMGIVYLARDTTLDRDVAIKMLPVDAGSDVRRRARLRQEARAAAAVPHPGIAQVYAYEEDASGAGFVVSEFVPGRTLREVIDEGPVAPQAAIGIAVQIAGAVAAAHARGVVHRDLKPENVMQGEEGAIKVLDFGLARLTELAMETRSRLTMTGAVLGTPGYMSPEQLRGAETGPGTDIFALGLILHEMLTGRHAFGSDASTASMIVRILEHEPNPLPSATAASLPGIQEIVERCLRKEPAARFQSMRELAAALQQVAALPAGGGHRSSAAEWTRSGSAVNAGRSGSSGHEGTGWWQFHQAAVSALYVATIYPAWIVRGDPMPSWAHNLLVLSIVVVAALVATVRLHWVFIARVHPGQLGLSRRRARPWARLLDVLMGLLLLVAAGAALARDRVWFAALFSAVAASATVAFLLIEPATEAAAFGEPPA